MTFYYATISHMFPRKKHGKIKAVLFDLGKVIFDFNFNSAFRRLSKAAGLPAEDIRGYFFRSGLEVLYDGGRISSRRFYQEVKKALGHSLRFDQFKKVWNGVFTPNDAVIGLVRRLGPKVRLVLISNTNAMHYSYLRNRYDVMGYFDRVILSYREKRRKPDAAIYRAAIRACRARAPEIFYIDDREDLTEAAREMGFQTFTFKNNPRAMEKRMKELEIL